MINKREWIKFLRILLTRLPVMLFLGLTVISFIIGWALDFGAFILCIFPVVFLCLTVGTIGQIFFLSGAKIARQVKEDIKKESDDLREQNLDDLYLRLTKDNDPRTERALKDLREIARAIKESTNEDSRLDIQTIVELRFKVEELFNKCVIRLEKSLKLLNSSQEISNQQVKQRLLKLREDIIGEVKISINYLGDILARVQILNCKQGLGKENLLAIMKDLEQGIAIAEKVDERMKKLELGEK